MGQHLNPLKIRIREYFPPLKKQYKGSRPFDADAMYTNLTTFEKEQLIEVSCDPTMKNKYMIRNSELDHFSIHKNFVMSQSKYSRSVLDHAIRINKSQHLITNIFQSVSSLIIQPCGPSTASIYT